MSCQGCCMQRGILRRGRSERAQKAKTCLLGKYDPHLACAPIHKEKAYTSHRELCTKRLPQQAGQFQYHSQEWPRQTKPKKGQFMNFLQGHFGTKVQCESCLFSQRKTPEFTKMGEIHELFVLALSLVWFAGATPDRT